VLSGPNIHTDDEVARTNGLPGRVADGMISTNWLSSILVESFGDAYVARGRLRTRYRRPVFVDVPLSAVVRVAELHPGADGERHLMAEVFCETPDGERVTEGVAAVPLT
jgi:3-hydroxybutyryl-CoA dehydratase